MAQGLRLLSALVEDGIAGVHLRALLVCLFLFLSIYIPKDVSK